MNRLLFIIFLIGIGVVSAQEKPADYALVVGAYNNDMQAVEEALADSAFVDATSEDGVTALMYAAQNGNDTMVDLLIMQGASVNASPSDGFTALISACLFNRLEAAVALIEQGADINASNMYGATPLMIAAAYGYYIITDMLLYYNANTALKDAYGNTALNIAATHGFADITGLLIRKGASLEITDEEGNTALNTAVMSNQPQVVDTLLFYKAPIDMQNKLGYTALMISIRSRNDTLIRKLLAARADVSLKTVYGLNAADLALINSNKPLYYCLSKDKKFTRYLPLPGRIRITPALNFTTNDIMHSYAVGLVDIRHDIILETGFATRFGKKKVLLERNGQFFQFNEKRSLFFLALTKEILLQQTPNGGMGINAGIKGLYSYGSMEGTIINAPSMYRLVPMVGYYYLVDFLSIGIGYEYLNFKTVKVSPHRINLSLGININLKKNPSFNTSIPWIN